MEDTAPTTEALALPGFRFHPTEEELLDFYLKNIVFGKKLRIDIIRFINIYHHDPWDLPGLAKMGEREWYFFVPRDRKQGGGRPNRTTEKGFWKATGSDRKIFSLSDQKKIIGLRKTLVFYTGRAPRGSKTDWVMNEYRLPDSWSAPKDIVLCKIYRKATSLKVLEQMALMEEEVKGTNSSPTSSRSSSMETTNPFSSQQDHLMEPMPAFHMAPKKEELEVFVDFEEEEARDYEEEAELGNVMMNNGVSTPSSASSPSSLKLPAGMDLVSELQVPKLNMDWTQDQFWTQFNSPWLQNLNQLLQQT